ncbi:MAG: hypothetical protein H6Q65_360 [Firmicutes bacterium]|nr:hypothetical protein [Bacillota bacterium]
MLGQLGCPFLFAKKFLSFAGLKDNRRRSFGENLANAEGFNFYYVQGGEAKCWYWEENPESIS